MVLPEPVHLRRVLEPLAVLVEHLLSDLSVLVLSLRFLYLLWPLVAVAVAVEMATDRAHLLLLRDLTHHRSVVAVVATAPIIPVPLQLADSCRSHLIVSP